MQIDDLAARNRNYVLGSQVVRPNVHVAVVGCMDARVDLYRILGLKSGEAHLIRNAGGVVTDDVIRSLVISHMEHGTREVMLIHHTQCGMVTFSDEELRDRPPWTSEGFWDVEKDVRRSISHVRRSIIQVRANPFFRHRVVRGFILDIRTGLLEEVPAAPAR
jgi:carbonic anhydrase